MGPQRLYKPWNPPLVADPFLFVLLKKEDWQKAKPKVFVLIHKQGDSTQSFEKPRIYEFTSMEFIDGGKDSHGDEIVWAMHDMTSSGITSDMVASTKSLQELKRQLAVQLTEYKGDQIVAHEEEASTLTLNKNHWIFFFIIGQAVIFAAVLYLLVAYLRIRRTAAAG